MLEDGHLGPCLGIRMQCAIESCEIGRFFLQIDDFVFELDLFLEEGEPDALGFWVVRVCLCMSGGWDIEKEGREGMTYTDTDIHTDTHTHTLSLYGARESTRIRVLFLTNTDTASINDINCCTCVYFLLLLFSLLLLL